MASRTRRCAADSPQGPSSTRWTPSTGFCSSTACATRPRSPPGSSSTGIGGQSFRGGGASWGSGWGGDVVLVRAGVARRRSGGTWGADLCRGRADRRGRGGRLAAAGRCRTPGRTHPPRSRERALARIPAGVARANAGRQRIVLDLARADVRAGGEDRPGLVFGARPRDLRRDGAGGRDGGRRVPLSAPRTGRGAV